MNVIINGALGRMGHEVTRLLRETDLEPVALVDRNGGDGVFSKLQDFTGSADVVIDFSWHACVGELLDFCSARKIPLVIATTGHTPEEIALISKAAETIPIFRAANLSLGVALLARLVKQAAAIFGGCDVEIIEKHHNRKIDSPSGTALMLADAVKETRTDATYVCGRSGKAKREPNEIGIHSLRMGNVVGEHEVIFATDSQTITLKHQAHDRALFAEGAISAANFMIGKPAGLYNMEDLLG